MRDWLADIWDRLNPSEPTTFFLVKFMAATLALFFVAATIGRLTGG